MLKIVHLMVLVTSFSLCLMGQPSIDHLAKGDRLTTYTDLNPQLDSGRYIGQRENWDFSDLKFEKNEVFNVKSPHVGSAIPVIGQADVLLESDRLEYYYSYDDDKLIFNGTNELELIHSNELHDHVIRYDGYEEFNAQIFNRREINTQSSGITELFSDDLPADITDTWDELNYRYLLKRSISQKMINQGTGYLKLSDGKYEVTKIIIERNITQQVLAKDVEYAHEDMEIESSIPAAIREKEIRFYKDGLLFPVLKIIVDAHTDIAQKVIYTSYNDKSVNAREISQEDLSIRPNPTFGKSDILVEVKKAGDYKILVKNILGRVIYEENITVDNMMRVPVNLMFLRKGSYFCSLVDHTGRSVVTKKLIILKP